METIYETLCTSIDELCTQYADIGIQKIQFGTSYLGRQIPALRLGEGSHRLLYLGGMTGSIRTAALLLRFARDYASAVRSGMRIAGIDISYLQHTRSITVVPQLNVDGAVLRCDGTDEKNPLLSRLFTMTAAGESGTAANTADGENAFAHWVCNGRGVDLRYNFDADFAAAMSASHGIGGAGFPGMYPESEPECAAVAGYLRGAPTTDLALIFGDGSDKGGNACAGQIAWSGADHRTRALAQILSRDIDGRGYETDSVGGYGSLCDWYRTLRAGPLLHITLPHEGQTDEKESESDLCPLDEADREQLHALLRHDGSAPGDTLARAALALQYGKLRKMLFHGAVL